MICILAISKVSRFQLVSVAEQAGLNLTWSKVSEDMFSRDVVHLIPSSITATRIRPVLVKYQFWSYLF